MNSREDKMIRAMHIINRCVAANSKKEDEDAGIEALEFGLDLLLGLDLAMQRQADAMERIAAALERAEAQRSAAQFDVTGSVGPAGWPKPAKSGFAED